MQTYLKIPKKEGKWKSRGKGRKVRNTEPGEDTIHPQMIKNLPPETLKYFLDMYNKILEEREKPKTWKHATIIPLLKEGQDPKMLGTID